MIIAEFAQWADVVCQHGLTLWKRGESNPRANVYENLVRDIENQTPLVVLVVDIIEGSRFPHGVSNGKKNGDKRVKSIQFPSLVFAAYLRQ